MKRWLRSSLGQVPLPPMTIEAASRVGVRVHAVDSIGRRENTSLVQEPWDRQVCGLSAEVSQISLSHSSQGRRRDLLMPYLFLAAPTMANPR